MEKFLLDAFPVLCWLQEEPGHEITDDLLAQAEEKRISLWMSMINLGEVFYRICRVSNLKKAEETVDQIRLLPISLLSASDTLVMEAARIKGKYPISYADAFASASALLLGATLVTGDPEYRSLSKLLRILWIT